MPDFKVTLIHPSRGRPEKALATATKWIRSAGVDVEHILSLDESEPTNGHGSVPGASKYITLFNGHLPEYRVTVNPNSAVVEAANHAAKISTGDILIYLSDDFDCPDNWGPPLLNEFREDRPLLVKVDDCLQGFHVPVLTIPIMNRQLYNKLGYFWYPGYKSMFVDEDLYWTAKKHNALKLAPHLKYPHNHVSTGKAPDDETYRRTAAHWDQGKALFAQRKAAGFP